MRDGTLEGVVEVFRDRQVVVLSPHFDDACFSLGTFLSALGRGIVVNIFTRGTFLAGIPRSTVTVDYVRSIRGSEDRAFARHCGLECHDLYGSEPALDGRKSFDRSHLETDVARITAPVLDNLGELASTGVAKLALFCPLGIGGHVNHLATFEAVVRNADRIRDRFDLFFYEDLPYAANPFRRALGLARLRRFPGETIRRTVIPASWREKKQLVDFYPSQFRRPPGAWRFRPAAPWPLSVHEAFWRFAT